MKFIFVGLFTVLFMYQCITTEAAEVGLRSKRSLSLEYCPEKSTTQECVKYAEEKLAKNKTCKTYVVSGKHIEWQHCPSQVCPIGAKDPIEDPSKPYPECCGTCG